jgi:heparin binding hemagglutinin HbhA
MATPKLDLKRVIDAGVGVTDLAVKTVRDYSADAQKRLSTAQRTVMEFDPKTARAAIEDTYVDLVKRGQSLVGRITRQPSTQEAVAAAETTVVKAKTTRTQAKKSTAAPRRTAKATKTAAKKTVSASSRALADGAKKVGS